MEECDFDFCKKGPNEKEVKGSVRRKINSLPSIMNMFSTETSVEEDFEKNRIRCSLAAGNVSATLGFFVAGKDGYYNSSRNYNSFYSKRCDD